MPSDETVMDAARRHVVTGKRLIVRQQNLIGHMKLTGLDASRAEAMLATMRKLQRIFERHLAQMEGAES